MENDAQKVVLVDPEERWPLHVAGSVLYYRRLSIGALAAIERRQAIPLQGDRRGDPPRMVVPPAALEQAICAHVLVGWSNVNGPDGQVLEFTTEAARLLPSSIRKILVRAAQEPTPPEGES